MKVDNPSEKREKFIAFVTDYALHPSAEKSFCDKESLASYGVMPSQKGNVTEEELEALRRHPEAGEQIAQELEAIRRHQKAIRHHHERWDGKGYPEGLANTDIPIEARIFAVADVFDALAHDRPYKKGWPVELAYAELKKLSGQHLDPVIVDRFLHLHAKKTAF
jgi:HD-GYP domain-containing protein (c-di-GMP phosphodiesterase class II)